MSEIIRAIRAQPRRALLYGAGISLSVVAIQFLWRRYFSSRTHRIDKPKLRYTTWNLSGKCKIEINAFVAAIEALENLLLELENQRFTTEIGRGRYDLISSVISRLKGICDDLQRYMSDDIIKKTNTDEIARTIWNGARQMPKTGTLSVFSEDSFDTACDDIVYPRDLDSTSVSLSIDFDSLKIYMEGLYAVDSGLVKYRKSRAEQCQCDSDRDFGAKVFCLRKAFKAIMADERRMQGLIQSGRQIIAGLLRHDGKDPEAFYTAYDRMMEFLVDESNRLLLMEELAARKVFFSTFISFQVEEINLWDVLFDFVILDAFDDLKKPPATIVALVKNKWFSQSMKESTINNLIWSMITVKEGFISRFYDISQVITSSLTLGILGGNNSDFAEICTFFKENIYMFICEIFNVNRVRYTSYEDLAEDVEKLMTEHMEIIKIKLNNELLPAF